MRLDRFPRGQFQPGNIRSPRFDPALMFSRIATNDLDFQEWGSCSYRYVTPALAAFRHRINAIGNDMDAELQV